MLRPFSLLGLIPLLLAPLAGQGGDRGDEGLGEFRDRLVIPPPPILTPGSEAAAFSLVPGFRIERVASESLVANPIAVEFGPDGRLWVVESRGLAPDAGAKGERERGGGIAVLEDTDHDGRYDRRTVFADRLVLPQGITLVGDGLLVAEPPTLWFLRDTDGDGVADEQRTIATDLGEIRDRDHSAGGLLRALDNWIYSASSPARFRRQGEGAFRRDATVARDQVCLTQDDAGRIFHHSRRDPLRYEAIPSGYLKRNPAFSAAGAKVPLVTGPLRSWPGRVTPGGITVMSAAAGPVVYRGGLFPAEFRGDIFVPEPAAGLIKRIRIKEKDGVLTGAKAYEGREFLTSTDGRFQPVNLVNGPEGALYVVDCDRSTGLGRIWRIVPEGAPKADFKPVLAAATTLALAEKLGDANGWVRDTAQRLLVERRDPAAVTALRAAAIDTGKPAVARRHALWTLEGLGADALDAATLVAALADPDPGVVAVAVRLSEREFREKANPDLTARVLALVQSRSEPAVRLQLALTLGEIDTPAADVALRDLVVRAGRQPLLADAVVSGLAGRENRLVEALVRHPAAAAQSGEVLRYATSAILKSGDAARIERVLGIVGASVTPEWARIPMLSGVRHFLPKGPDGTSYPALLPAEPTPLVALAADPASPAALIVRPLLAQLYWPGKPGAPARLPVPLNEQ